MPKLSNTEAPTITEKAANKPAEGTIVLEEENHHGEQESAQSGQNGAPEEGGVAKRQTLDELLRSDPTIKAEYDRKMHAAISKHDAKTIGKDTR